MQVSATSNEIALRNRVSDLVIKINEVALNHPEIELGYTPTDRLNLIRIEYFFQVFNLKKAGVYDEERVKPEFEYLKWAIGQKVFRDTWLKVENEYPADFGAWVKTALQAK